MREIRGPRVVIIVITDLHDRSLKRLDTRKDIFGVLIPFCCWLVYVILDMASTCFSSLFILEMLF